MAQADQKSPVDVGTESTAHDQPSTTSSSSSFLQQPRSRRGPFSLKDSVGVYLPKYDGPHPVGTVTLELPFPQSVQVPPHPSIPRPQTVQFTLFYPASVTPKTPAHRTRWLGSSACAMLDGYAKYFKIGTLGRFLSVPMARLMVGGIHLPTYSQAPFAPPLKGEGLRRLIIWSHGLSGTKTLYSQYCGQLASRGHVVASLAHRDGSAPYTVSNSPDGGSDELAYVALEDLPVQERPKDILDMRGGQLATRTAEVLATSTVLESLSKEMGWQAIKNDNLYVKGAAGWEGEDGTSWTDQDWQALSAGTSWDSNVIVAGHSFGGGTIMAAIRRADRPSHWTSAIMLDPWLEPLPHWPADITPLKPNLTLPSLVINSPGFTVWTNHYKELVRIIKSGDHADKSWICTVSDISHTTFSDLPIVLEGPLKLMGKIKLSPQRAMEIFVAATLQFLGDDGDAEKVLVGSAEGAGSESLVKTKPPGTVTIHLAPTTV